MPLAPLTKRHLLLLGAGYTAGFIAQCAAEHFDLIDGTTRSTDQFSRLRSLGIKPVLFDGLSVSDELLQAIRKATHIVVSIAPTGTDPLNDSAQVDPLLRCVDQLRLQETLGRERTGSACWLGYLSTVGVYGNASGQWVDESTVCVPGSLRSRLRLRAEQQWQELADSSGAPLSIFRLPGIYGPGRNALLNVHAGKARRIVKSGQVFNRGHVEDIAVAVRQAMLSRATGIYNICDDSPAPPQDVVSFAAHLMGVDAPPEIDFDTADLSPMARSFYGENKRVSNARSRSLPGMSYRYADYKSGLTALWESGSWNRR